MKRRSFVTGSAAAVAALITDSSLSSASVGDKVNNPLTIVKVGNDTYKPSSEDLERWRAIFAGQISLDDCPPHMKQNPPSTEVFEADPDYHRLLLVRVGDEQYSPSKEDLEMFRDIFQNAADDKDFKIFTHSSINIEEIRFGSGGVIVEKD